MRLLLLAGTWEARQIAAGLTREPRIQAVASLARAERVPSALGIPTRIGGFGGDAGFADWVRREGIVAIVDATHPFSVRISLRTQRTARELGIDYIQFLRPSWLPDEEDDWTFLNTEEEAARHIPAAARVFIATGRGSLDRFHGLEDHHLFVRQLGGLTQPFPFPHGGFVGGLPPFSLEREIATLDRLGIDWLIARNSGGMGSRAKLDAARQLGIKVAMVRRPPQPDGPKANTLAEVMAWIRRRL